MKIDRGFMHLDANSSLKDMELYYCTIKCDFELNSSESKRVRSEIYKKVFGNAVLEGCSVLRK